MVDGVSWCGYLILPLLECVFELCCCPNLLDYEPAEWWFVSSLGHSVDMQMELSECSLPREDRSKLSVGLDSCSEIRSIRRALWILLWFLGGSVGVTVRVGSECSVGRPCWAVGWVDGWAWELGLGVPTQSQVTVLQAGQSAGVGRVSGSSWVFQESCP